MAGRKAAATRKEKYRSQQHMAEQLRRGLAERDRTEELRLVEERERHQQESKRRRLAQELWAMAEQANAHIVPIDPDEAPEEP